MKLNKFLRYNIIQLTSLKFSYDVYYVISSINDKKEGGLLDIQIDISE